jgi:hypothetical protein
MNALLAMLLAQADEANHAAARALDQYDAGEITHAHAMAICNAGALPHEAIRAYQADHNP